MLLVVADSVVTSIEVSKLALIAVKSAVVSNKFLSQILLRIFYLCIRSNQNSATAAAACFDAEVAALVSFVNFISIDPRMQYAMLSFLKRKLSKDTTVFEKFPW